MLRWLRDLLRGPPTVWALLAEQVAGAAQEAARLDAYAEVAQERLEELEASAALWGRRARAAEGAGATELANAAKLAALEDSARVILGRVALERYRADADNAARVMMRMQRDLIGLSRKAQAMAVRVPTFTVNTSEAQKRARQEAIEDAQMDGLEDAMDRDFLTRAFERFEASGFVGQA